jgi:hypothetical protein
MNTYRNPILVLLCVLVVGCQRDDRRLYGSWRSDAEQSMAWNRTYVKLTEKQVSGLSQMFGHMTVTYLGNGKGQVVMEPYTLTVGTNVHHMSGFTNAAAYKVLCRTDDSVTLKTTSGIMSDHVATVHFDGADMYWLLLNEDDPARSAREYFKRTRSPNHASEGIVGKPGKPSM